MTSSQCAFSQRKVVSQFKKWNEQLCVLFMACTIYKSYIGQTNRKRNKSALLVWATDRVSARIGAAGCSRSRDTVIHSAGRYSEESSRISRRIHNISVKYCEKHSNSAHNYVKATDIRTNSTDVENRRNVVQ